MKSFTIAVAFAAALAAASPTSESADLLTRAPKSGVKDFKIQVLGVGPTAQWLTDKGKLKPLKKDPRDFFNFVSTGGTYGQPYSIGNDDRWYQETEAVGIDAVEFFHPDKTVTPTLDPVVCVKGASPMSCASEGRTVFQYCENTNNAHGESGLLLSESLDPACDAVTLVPVYRSS